VPAGVAHVTFYRASKPQQQDQLCAHVKLEDDGPKMKSCSIHVFDETGPMLSCEKNCYAQLGVTSEPEAAMYTAKWVESSHGTSSEACNKAYSVVVIQISQYLLLDTTFTENKSAPMVTLSELRALDADKVPLNLIVPLPML